jgi:hypothetical protein
MCKRNCILARALNESDLQTNVLICIRRRITEEIRAVLRGGPVEQLPRVSTSKGLSDVTRIMGNIVPVNSVSNRRKNFTYNYQQFWALALKKFCPHCPKQKKFKKYRFKTAQNYWTAKGARIHMAGTARGPTK